MRLWRKLPNVQTGQLSSLFSRTDVSQRNITCVVQAKILSFLFVKSWNTTRSIVLRLYSAALWVVLSSCRSDYRVGHNRNRFCELESSYTEMYWLVGSSLMFNATFSTIRLHHTVYDWNYISYCIVKFVMPRHPSIRLGQANWHRMSTSSLPVATAIRSASATGAGQQLRAAAANPFTRRPFTEQLRRALGHWSAAGPAAANAWKCFGSRRRAARGRPFDVAFTSVCWAAVKQAELTFIHSITHCIVLPVPVI